MGFRKEVELMDCAESFETLRFPRYLILVLYTCRASKLTVCHAVVGAACVVAAVVQVDRL